MIRVLTYSLAALACVLAFAARNGLDDASLKMLQDPGGWEYISVDDSDSGIQTQHTCFDGRPHPQECSGTLMLAPDNTFVQNIHIHGQTVGRHGTYKLESEKIAFFDEYGAEDGPYSLDLNTQTKQLVLSMAQVHIQLELESQYRDDLKNHKRPQH